MHELALADAVVRTALDAAGKANVSRITRMVVRIGELQSIKLDVFEFALKEILPANEPRLSAADIALEIEPARFRCRPCGHAFGLDDETAPKTPDEAEAIHFVPELAHGFLRCPSCRSPDFEVLEGRGVSIAELEGDEDEDEDDGLGAGGDRS